MLQSIAIFIGMPINCDYFCLPSEYKKMTYRLIGNYHGREFHHYWRLTNPDMLSITKDGGRDHQEHEDTNNEASHGGAGT